MLLRGAFKSRSISCNKSNFRVGHGPSMSVVHKMGKVGIFFQMNDFKEERRNLKATGNDRSFSNPPLTRQTASRSAEITAI